MILAWASPFKFVLIQTTKYCQLQSIKGKCIADLNCCKQIKFVSLCYTWIFTVSMFVISKPDFILKSSIKFLFLSERFRRILSSQDTLKYKHCIVDEYYYSRDLTT